MKRRYSLSIRTGALGFLAALAPLLLPVPPLGAQTGAETRDVSGILDQLRKTYESEAAALLRQAETADAQWIAHYGEAVARFTQEAQAQGDFETWQAGSRECERFDKARSIAAGDLVQKPEALRTLQQRALEGRIEVRRKAARDTVDLTERLVTRLEAMTRELTIRGDAGGARQTIEAVARIRAHEIYSDALFSLDTREPFPAPASSSANPETPAPPASEPNAEPAATPSAAVSLRSRPSSPGVRVSAPDVAPAPVSGTRLCLLAPTDACPPGSSPLSVSARYLIREKVSFRQHDQNYSLDLVDVQVNLKAQPDALRVEGLTITVQYFAGRTRGDPFPVQYTLAQLAAVDTRTLYLQMPPVSYQMQIVPSALGGTRPFADRTLQFRGVAITIFNAAGKILHQSVSDRGLLSWAGDARRYNEDGTLNFP